jgi:plasmid stabilization system protein ParE
MKVIEWSPKAQGELFEAVAWLLSRNPSAAVSASDDIMSAVKAAAMRPSAKRAASANNPDIRIKSLPRWHKIIVYQIQPDRIVIVSIRDTRQEPKVQ